jgi:hypothetical protein
MEVSFLYIATFISLIYGLALAHALSCISEYVQNWSKIKHYWVWWIWAMFLLLLSVGFWWSIYAFWNKTELWKFANFAFLTLQSSLFYLTYYIFFNHFNELEDKNLESEYYRYKKIFFILLPLQFILMFFGHDYLANNATFRSMFNRHFFVVVQSLAMLFLAFVNNKIVHAFFAAFFFLLFIIQIILMG